MSTKRDGGKAKRRKIELDNIYFLACYETLWVVDDDNGTGHEEQLLVRARAPLNVSDGAEAIVLCADNASNYIGYKNDRLTLLRLVVATPPRWEEHVDGVWLPLPTEPEDWEYDSESGSFLEKPFDKNFVDDEPCEKCGGPVTPNEDGRLECGACGPDLYPHLP